MRRITRRHFGALATAAVFGRTARAVQVDYSIDDREAQKRILPAAAEVKAAV
jgi:hypothetical protein